MATGISNLYSKMNNWVNRKPKLGGSWSRYTPKIMGMAQKPCYWASIEAEVETYLKNSIPIKSPESVFEPMHHLTFAAPRSSAPALCVAACELVGGDRSQAVAAASAIHLVHAAAYTHQNLPLTDRPRPKVEHKYAPNVELLTGDGILPFGFELVARSMDQTNPNQILRVIIEISRAGGSQGVVDGQFKEAGIQEYWDLEVIEYVCRKKEGGVHACAAACGAILGGAAEDEIQKLRNFGLYAGTLQGMTPKCNSPTMEERIERLKELAFKELASFKGNPAGLELILGLFELSSVVCEQL